MRCIFRHIFVCLSLAFLLSGAYASDCDPGFSCWVDSLTLPIPSTTFNINIAGYTLSINDTTCQDIQVPTLSSSLPSPLTFQINANVEMNCTGTWTLSSPQDSGSGTMEAIITTAKVTSGVLIYTNASYSLVGAVGALCSVTDPHYSLTFQGATSNQSHPLSEFAGLTEQ